MKNKCSVLKFGGVALADFERMGLVADYIAERARKDEQLVVAVSAMGETTKNLRNVVSNICIGEPPRDELDKVLMTGEQLAAAYLAIMLQQRGIKAISRTGEQIGLEADSEGMVKRISKIDDLKMLLEGDLSTIIVAGFQGKIVATDEPICLGEGGTEMTAVALAASLGLDECELFKDEDGVYAANPKFLPNAKRLKDISYWQVGELCISGAEIIMARAVSAASKLGIKFRVKRSPSLGGTTGGTLVSFGEANLEDIESSFLQLVIANRDATLFNVSNLSNEPGISAKIFSRLKERGVSIRDGNQSPGRELAGISFLASPNDESVIIEELNALREESSIGNIEINNYGSMMQLTLVPSLILNDVGYFAKVFEALGKASINIESYGSAGNAVWVAVRKDCVREALVALAKKFDLMEE